MRFMLAFAAILITSTPALSQTEGTGSPVPPQAAGEAQAQPMRIDVDTRTIEEEDAYAEAVDKLTPVQKNELDVLDKEFVKTMSPIMDLYELGGKVIFCINSEAFPAAERPKYVSAFKEFQQVKTREQEAMWKTHRANAAQVSYIDHALMDGHYSYIQAIQKAAAVEIVEKTGKTGGYSSTNCQEVQKTLEDAHKTLQSTGNSGTSTPAAP